MEIEVKGNELVVNAKDWRSFTTIEDSKELMELVIKSIIEKPEVERVLISEEREIEYPESQVKMLKEIADVYAFLLKKKVF